MPFDLSLPVLFGLETSELYTYSPSMYWASVTNVLRCLRRAYFFSRRWSSSSRILLEWGAEEKRGGLGEVVGKAEGNVLDWSLSKRPILSSVDLKVCREVRLEAEAQMSGLVCGPKVRAQEFL